MSVRLIVGVLVGALSVPVYMPAEAASCGSNDVKALMRSFARAYNDGDLRKLDRLFPKGERFRSYDVHPTERVDGHDRSTLIDYFEERHSFKDAMSLSRVRAGRYDNGNRGFGFSLELDRTSDELAPFAQGHFTVKGSATCDGIYFWNMTWNRP